MSLSVVCGSTPATSIVNIALTIGHDSCLFLRHEFAGQYQGFPNLFHNKLTNLGNLDRIRHAQGWLAFRWMVADDRSTTAALAIRWMVADTRSTTAASLSVGWWLTTGPPWPLWFSVGWELMTGPPGQLRLASCQHSWQLYQAKLSVGW